MRQPRSGVCQGPHSNGLTGHGKEFGIYSEYRKMPLEGVELCRGIFGKMKHQKASHGRVCVCLGRRLLPGWYDDL